MLAAAGVARGALRRGVAAREGVARAAAAGLACAAGLSAWMVTSIVEPPLFVSAAGQQGAPAGAAPAAGVGGATASVGGGGAALKLTGGLRQPGLPSIPLAEVRKRNDPRTGPVWVYFKEGVYDITDFIAVHPGGAARIVLAAGGDLAPFWRVFAAHQTEHVHEVLEGLRVGNLAEADVRALEEEARRKAAEHGSSADPYAQDPERPPLLQVRTAKPFNAETPPAMLLSSFLTPIGAHYVRNHLPVPVVDARTYRLVVDGPGVRRPLSLSLEDLERLPQHTVATSIQCAGNRRGEMNRDSGRDTRGLAWTGGAIGTAEWTGVWLRDVLRAADFCADGDASSASHVVFEGLDRDPTDGKGYGASIPIQRALDPNADVLVALRMNGAPIPRDHGYPVRLVAPGVVGARNVKWLHRIHASAEESLSFWQRLDYKGLSPGADGSAKAMAAAESIQAMPVQSAICDVPTSVVLPAAGAAAAPVVLLRGYAYSGGGRRVVRVDVTPDGGESWVEAHILPPPEHIQQRETAGRAWTWRFWEAHVPLPPAFVQRVRAAKPREDVPLRVAARAVDCSFNVQPEQARFIWNVRGVLNNSWSSATVPVRHE
jgi:sulfite oxidase